MRGLLVSEVWPCTCRAADLSPTPSLLGPGGKEDGSKVYSSHNVLLSYHRHQSKGATGNHLRGQGHEATEILLFLSYCSCYLLQ